LRPAFVSVRSRLVYLILVWWLSPFLYCHACSFGVFQNPISVSDIDSFIVDILHETCFVRVSIKLLLIEPRIVRLTFCRIRYIIFNNSKDVTKYRSCRQIAVNVLKIVDKLPAESWPYCSHQRTNPRVSVYHNIDILSEHTPVFLEINFRISTKC
jgi:hypothetical protein